MATLSPSLCLTPRYTVPKPPFPRILPTLYSVSKFLLSILCFLLLKPLHVMESSVLSKPVSIIDLVLCSLSDKADNCCRLDQRAKQRAKQRRVR